MTANDSHVSYFRALLEKVTRAGHVCVPGQVTHPPSPPRTLHFSVPVLQSDNVTCPQAHSVLSSK